jgi:hypothetical protein
MDDQELIGTGPGKDRGEILRSKVRFPHIFNNDALGKSIGDEGIAIRLSPLKFFEGNLAPAPS